MSDVIILSKSSSVFRESPQCAYCHSVFTPGDRVVRCSSCHTAHHEQCWIERGNACAVLGCASVRLTPSDAMTETTPIIQITPEDWREPVPPRQVKASQYANDRSSQEVKLLRTREFQLFSMTNRCPACGAFHRWGIPVRTSDGTRVWWLLNKPDAYGECKKCHTRFPVYTTDPDLARLQGSDWLNVFGNMTRSLFVGVVKLGLVLLFIFLVFALVVFSAQVYFNFFVCPPRCASANLHDVNWTYRDLHEVDLSRANLYGANLYGAKLYEANLYEANLYGANLSGANLSGANLYGANLSGANLSGANLDSATLIQAVYNQATKWPEGFYPPPGMILDE